MEELIVELRLFLELLDHEYLTSTVREKKAVITNILLRIQSSKGFEIKEHVQKQEVANSLPAPPQMPLPEIPQQWLERTPMRTGNTASTFSETTEPSGSTDRISIRHPDPNCLRPPPPQHQPPLKPSLFSSHCAGEELLACQESHQKTYMDQLENRFTELFIRREEDWGVRLEARRARFKNSPRTAFRSHSHTSLPCSTLPKPAGINLSISEPSMPDSRQEV